MFLSSKLLVVPLPVFSISFCFISFSIEKVLLDKALNLSVYLSRESEIMPVTQGFGELVPLYKLMEKRDMEELENQMKVVVAHMTNLRIM